MKKLSLLFLLLIGVSSLLSAKIKYQGFTGGMRIHTGYLTTKNYTIADPDQNIIFSNKAQGFPFGMGGAAKVQFGEHLRVGFEGYFSSLKQKNNGYISTGWGGALIDCVWHIKKWSPFVGTSIGGGSIKNLYLNANTNDDFTTDNNTMFRKYPFMAIVPFVGVEYAVSQKISFIFKVDCIFNVSNRESDYTLGPRFHFGISFNRLKKTSVSE